MDWKLVIFDLDGTLLDTIGDLGAAVDHAMELRGFPTHTVDEYKTMVGHGVRNLVAMALPEEHRDEATVDAALSDFRMWYESHIDVLTRPFPGIPEMLRDLDGGIAAIGVAWGYRPADALAAAFAGTPCIVPDIATLRHLLIPET